MRDHVVNSIRDAFALLVEAPPQVPDDLLPGSGLTRIRWARPPQQDPWFYKDDRNFESPQRAFFGFYLLARAARATLIGSRYLQVGDVLLDGDYCAAAVVAYYTAALNLTLSYLALEGRVFIDIPHGPPKPDPEPGEPMWFDLRGSGGQPQSVLAVLSRRGNWNFEARGRGHDSRWRELLKLLDELRREEPPSSLLDPFWKLLDYCTSYGPHHLGSVEAADDYEHKLLREGVGAITEIRHEAIYRGYGWDDFAVDLVMNGEGSGGGFDLKPRAFKSFGVSMVEKTAHDLEECFLAIDPSHWLALLPATSVATLEWNPEIGPP